MTVQVELTTDEEAALKRRARIRGEQLEDYVKRLVRRDIDSAAELERILGPFRDQVEASGITDDDLECLLESTRDSAAAARRVRTQ